MGRSLFAGTSPSLTWRTTLPWLTAQTTLPLILKGIQTHEDAHLASMHAPPHGPVRAIILSNHGGRAMDTAPPAVHVLLEIRKYCPHVFERVEVWVDGGVRRGTDVVKCVCLGARGVGLGRMPLYGLGAGGREGVRRVFESESFSAPYWIVRFQGIVRRQPCSAFLTDGYSPRAGNRHGGAVARY